MALGSIFGNFGLQIRILHVKILPGDTSKYMESSWKFKVILGGKFGKTYLRDRTFTRTIDRKLLGKQVKTAQKTSPEKPEIVYKPPSFGAVLICCIS